MNLDRFRFKDEFLIVNIAMFGRGLCSYVEYLSRSLQSTRLFVLFIDFSV